MKWASLVKMEVSAGLFRGSREESVSLPFPPSRGCRDSLGFGTCPHCAKPARDGRTLSQPHPSDSSASLFSVGGPLQLHCAHSYHIEWSPYFVVSS